MNDHPNSSPNAIVSPGASKQKLKPNDRMKLLNLLTVVLPMQKRYGTSEKELEAILEGWTRALGEFNIQQIVDATWFYVKRYPDIPAPSQIENIIRYNRIERPQNPLPTQRDIRED